MEIDLLTEADLFAPPDGQWNTHWHFRDWRELVPIVAERLPDGAKSYAAAYVQHVIGTRWYANAKPPQR